VKRLYLGLDVHAQSTTVAVVDEAGKRLHATVVPTTATALIDVMQRLNSIGAEVHACTEEGTQSAWVYETLRPNVDEIVVTMPVRKHGPKSDHRDAFALAERLRRGTLDRVVYKSTGPYTALRECVRAHRMITGDVIRAKNRIKAAFRARGLHVEGDELYDPQRREKWLQRLGEKHRPLATMMGAQLDAILELHRGATERLREEASHHGIVERLMTIPCIGIIRAAYIVATVVTPTRFRSKRQFWAYCGLAVVTQSSADWMMLHGRFVRSGAPQTRGLNRNRNPVMKEVFKGAALHIAHLDEDHPLKQDYQQLVARGLKPAIARITMARRLAATALSMWKKEEVYDASKRYRSSTINVAARRTA
jgi:transposase